MIEVLDEHKSRESCIDVVAGGTGTNTLWKDGMLAHMERSLRSILLWLICQLHVNELGLQHFFIDSDGGHGTN